MSETADTRVIPRLPPTFLEGGGELGALMRDHDWTRTPLGPPASWPQSLKTAVRIMLTSRQPFWLGWGPELTYLYNDPYKAIIGGKHPRALGRSFREVWGEIWDVVGPMADMVMTRNEGTYVEAQLLIMERHGYQEETYYTFSYSPIPNDEGAPGGLICANTDDTRRVIGERQMATLRELAARTANARNRQDACTLALEALATNPRDVLFALLYVADAPDKAPALVAATPESSSLAGVPWPWEEALRTGTSRRVPLSDVDGPVPRGAWSRSATEAAVLPIAPSGQGGHTGVLVVGLNPFRRFDEDYRGFLDLAARQVGAAIANAYAYEQERSRAEALAELDRAKTAFFSNVSHELRTPLTLMLGPIQEILGGSDDLSPGTRERLDVAHRNTLRLLKLVNTLLDFSRLEAGRIQVTYERTDLAAFTTELAGMFRSAIEQAGLRLVVDCPPLTAEAYVDRPMWEKIVFNLLSNAFKFTLAGAIEVHLRHDGDRIHLTVRDTGTGIPAAELPHIFERFHRVKGAQGRTFEGTGIGLALVRELVGLHGGTVEVESELGRGSLFTVTIPSGKAHLAEDRIGTAPALLPAVSLDYTDIEAGWLPPDDARHEKLPGAARGTARILLADDNADMRDYLSRLLSPRYDVEAVGDGVAALAAARERTPELLLTDVMMPGLDGFGLLSAFRADDRLKTVPVIMLSARAGEEARVEGIAAGADDYLVKPFSARELLARVQSRLEQVRTQRALHDEAHSLEILNRVGTTIAAELDLERLVQAVTDAATELSGAQFGAFFYNVKNTAGESYLLYSLSGAPREAFASLGMPRNTAIFGPTFAGQGVVRLDDVTRDARYGKNAPHHGMPKGHLPVRSYLAVPVISRSGEVLGGLFFGHPEAGVFSERSERLVRGIAAQAAVAIDNARLHEQSKHLIEQLRDADTRKDEFIATLSHELRNPLAPLQNSLQVMRLSGPGSGPDPRVQQVMERQVSHLVRLVDDLLEMSRISRGTFELRKERIDLAVVVRNAIETSEPLMKAAAHAVRVDLPNERLTVEGDPVRLTQILANLLNNAANYTDRGGEVTVSVHREERTALISVRDTGIGITPDVLPRIFEMFSRGERVSRRGLGGLGIGLALARRLAEMHGGSISARSEGAGRGSVFVVRLPLVEVENLERNEPDDRGASGLKQRILIVDDNTDGAESLAMLLQMLGAEVRIAHDGPAALAAFESYAPDVILLDIGMPGMDGYEVARLIRDRHPRRKVAIAALTGWGQEEDRRRAREAGFDHHLVKPADLDALRAFLATVEDAGR